MQDYQDTLNDLELDIALIPRTENYFNKAKSNLKFLECSMLEIPCIASGFSDGLSPYEQGEDKNYLKLVKKHEDWYTYLEELSDKKTRRELGKKAKKYVLDKYDINKNIHLWEDAYKNLIK
jgi:glycosyltransferase involved in cell wall biosynthesis